MSSSIVTNILLRLRQPELLSLLSNRLSGTELNSLLLELFKKCTAGVTAPQLMNLYQKNRFVKPGDLPVIPLKQMELDLLKIFDSHLFLPLELSPVTILGACSVVATADQNKILSALRGTEVLADATNAIALHVSDLKKTKQWIPSANDKIRFSTIQRHVRTQSVSAKGFTPHFKIGCLVTCGMDTGNYLFEKESLAEHIAVMNTLYREYFNVESIRFSLLCRGGYDDPNRLAGAVADFVRQKTRSITIDIIDQPEKSNLYYKGIQYKIIITVKGKEYEIGDGGFVDWTQQLLQNRKERMLSTGIGFEFMYRILQGEV